MEPLMSAPITSTAPADPTSSGDQTSAQDAVHKPASDRVLLSHAGCVTSNRSYSSVLLAVSNFGVFAFPFARGVVLARLLSPQDFGLAISITTVASVVDIISDVGLYQFAVRVSSPTAIATLHSVALVRAVFIAATIAACSPLCAYLFNAPGTAWAYALVGLAPLIRGLYHLNVKSAMRNFDFAKEAITELVGHTVWTVVSIASAFIIHDYRAMIIGLVANAVSVVAMTHILANFRWKLGWDRSIVRDAAYFGRPMIPNGAATVVVNMGDRTLVGSFSGLDALASYSVLTTSAFTPRSACLRFLNALLTSQFVNADTPAREDKLLTMSAIVLSAVGGLFAFGYMALGQAVIALIFGKHYAVSQEIVSLVGILSCLRFIAAITTSIGVAKGYTGLIFLNTFTQGTGLALGLLLLLHRPELVSMVSGMCAGESVALLFIVARVLRSHKASTTGVWSAILPTLILVMGCAAFIEYLDSAALTTKVEIGLGSLIMEAVLLARVMSSQQITIRDLVSIFLPKRLR